ncbi:MAG: GGDEF domain-containing protein [Clostridiales bacterium]|nr:GGDEF domain-containing protein [Clostridiales bacterium]
MARKKLGVFMSEITQFFQQSCGKAIIDLASLRDMDVVVFASYGSYTSPYGRNLLSEIGKKNIIHLPDYSSLDAIIAMPSTFDIAGMDEEFYAIVRENAKCPVICLQTGRDDFYTISIDNHASMYQMTRHFIDEHHFTDICYMSGPFQAKDSPDRLRGFVDAMKDGGVAMQPNSIYEGNYWRNRGQKAMDFFMQERRSYPQAIICANDYMALSICDELKARGMRVPEDVCVCGFDGIQEGKDATPSLTTVQITPEKYAEAAFQILDDLKAGKEVDKKITLTDELLYRASCGCGKQFICGNVDEIYHSLAEKEFLLRESGRITADYQNNFDIDTCLSVANYYFHTLGCERGFICLCDDSDDLFSSEEETAFSEKMFLLQIMNKNDRLNGEAPNVLFPRKDVLPKEIFETDEPGVYIVLPLFFKNKDYGYIVLNPEKDQWPNSLSITYVSALSSSIESCFYEKKFSAIKEITKLSRTDELTGLYNRRGFENALQDVLKNTPEDYTISIASIDMDNLKTINDVHGHSDGDYALSAISHVLQDCLKENEFCARFGGDEFSAVLVAKEKSRAQEYIDNVEAELERVSKESGKPYSLHVSIGASKLAGRDTASIVNCMRAADEQMYQKKRAYKKEGNE